MMRNEEGSGGLNSLHLADPAIVSIPGILALPQGCWKPSRDNKHVVPLKGLGPWSAEAGSGNNVNLALTLISIH